jgi:hypothetical protein
MKKLSLLFLTLAMAAQAQNSFRAYSSTEKLLEGGQVEKMNVAMGDLRFTFRPPKKWGSVVDGADRKIVFTSPSGKSAVTVQFTANSPGALPEQDVLRAQVLQAHPGAEIMRSAVCPTSYKPGMFYDLVLVTDGGAMLKVRHAFVPQPGGGAEFILSASDDEFEKDKYILMAMLRAFRVETAKPPPS